MTLLSLEPAKRLNQAIYFTLAVFLRETVPRFLRLFRRRQRDLLKSHHAIVSGRPPDQARAFEVLKKPASCDMRSMALSLSASSMTLVRKLISQAPFFRLAAVTP